MPRKLHQIRARNKSIFRWHNSTIINSWSYDRRELQICLFFISCCIDVDIGGLEMDSTYWRGLIGSVSFYLRATSSH